ncbi:MAG: hypothetical protein WD851_02810 [Pirellulales bacterium]
MNVIEVPLEIIDVFECVLPVSGLPDSATALALAAWGNDAIAPDSGEPSFSKR